MKRTIWLIGNDRLNGEGIPDVNQSAYITQNFCAASSYTFDQNGKLVKETVAESAPPAEVTVSLQMTNNSLPFHHEGKEIVAQRPTVSDQICRLISALSSSGAKSWYTGFQYPLSMQIVTRLEDAGKEDQVKSGSYKIRTETELKNFLVDVLLPLVPPHEELEMLAENVHYLRIRDQIQPVEFWQAEAEQSLSKARELTARATDRVGVVYERSRNNYSHALEYFGKVYSLVDAQPKVAPVQNEFLQSFSVFMSKIVGTRDPVARTKATLLLNIAECKANINACDDLKEGVEDIKQAYELLYAAFGALDQDTCRAYALWEQAKNAQRAYELSRPCIAAPA